MMAGNLADGRTRCVTENGGCGGGEREGGGVRDVVRSDNADVTRETNDVREEEEELRKVEMMIKARRVTRKSMREGMEVTDFGGNMRDVLQRERDNHN